MLYFKLFSYFSSFFPYCNFNWTWVVVVAAAAGVGKRVFYFG